MKYTKCAIVIAGIMAILVGTQSFTQCRGDDSGTLTMNADSPTCLPISADNIQTAAFNAGALTPSNIVLANGLNTANCSTATGTSNLSMGGILQTGTISCARRDVNYSSALVKVGTGTISLSGINTYEGPTTISAGTLQLGNSAALGGVSSANCYNGATTITAGRLVLGNSAALGIANASSVVSEGGALDCNLSQCGTACITGQGTVAVGNGAIVNNSATNSTSTQCNINNLTLNGNATFGGIACWDISTSSGTATITSGTLRPNSSILHASSGTVNIGNAVFYGSLTPNVTFVSGAGTLIYDGSTDIQAGTLQLSNSAVTLSGTTLTAGAGLLNKTGAGTLVLSGSNTYAGTVISVGSLASNIIGSGATALINRSNTLSGNTITLGDLSIDAGMNITIAAFSDSPASSALQTPGDATEPVPEPSVMVLLSIAFLAFIRFGLRPMNSAIRL